MKQRKIAQPNYVRKLHYLYRIRALPKDIGLHLVTVYHDDWCGIYHEKRCDCNPDIKLRASMTGSSN